MYEELKNKIAETAKGAKAIPSALRDALNETIDTYKRLKSERDAQKKEAEVHRSMGLGQLRDTDLYFARMFRWTFEPNGKENDLTYFSKEVNLNLKTKEVEIHLYDVFKMNDGKRYSPTAEWIDEMVQGKRENVTLRGWDGCGKEMFNYEFDDLELTDHYTQFDYAKSDSLTHRVRLRFSKYRRTSSPSGSA